MSSAFIEIRIASSSGHICVCGKTIAKGDEYKREAIPPWAFKYRNKEGCLINTGDGFWIVLNRCYNCMPNQGGY